MKYCLTLSLMLILLLTACTSDSEFAEGDNFDTAVEATTVIVKNEEAPNEMIDNGTSYFLEDDCPFETTIDTITCGYLAVPEDRSNPESPLIELAVAIIPSASSTPQPDPIFYLEGGPGGNGLAQPESWLRQPFLQNRDIVLFDQRGTGYSEPSLNCPELEEGYRSDFEAAQACWESLTREGINLAAYNSAASAADINDLRLALGYEQINLLGISYGTRLALTVMRDFPEGIRSATLDSVYPPHIDGYTQEAAVTAATIQKLLQDCTAELACNTAYPNLETRFYTLVDNLNDRPVTIDELEEIIVLDGLAFIDQMRDWLYDTAAIPQLPRVIDALANDNTEPLIDLLLGPLGDGEPEAPISEAMAAEWEAISDSEGMYYSVECHEEIPFNDLDQAFALLEAYPPQLESAIDGTVTLFEVCQFWGAGQGNPIEDNIVISDIPTLILAGEYDPATPPSWGRAAAEGLSQSYFVEFPRAGHALLDAFPCTPQIVATFLANPTQPPAPDCLSEVVVPAFE